MAQNNPDCHRPFPTHWLEPKPPEPELEDMTPAEISQKYGSEVASYVVHLRSQLAIWKSLFNDRLSPTVKATHEQ